MKTLIEGGWVVAHNGQSHEVHERGSVVIENDTIVHACGPYPGAVDSRISARGKLVSPGFINTHVHTAGAGGDYLLLDMAKNDYRTANYMSFAAPLKGKMTPPPADAVAALRAFTFEEDTAVGQTRLREAIDFVRKYDGAAQGRLRGMLNAAQVETCSEPLLRAGKDAARELKVPIHTHAGGNLVEFQRIMDEYRKTPIQFLADIGFLDARTLLGHAVFTTGHPWSRYPFGDDLRVLAETGATVGHCPYKYAKMAMTLHSLPRYLEAGVNIALGTDTYPMNFIAEMRWAAVLARIVEGNFQVGRPRDMFNSATLAGCKFLQRRDLGRLAPGAKADMLIINLDHMAAAVYHDPIKALIDFGNSRDIETVIVDGRTLVQGGRSVLCDEAEVYAKAKQAARKAWEAIPTWHWGGYGLDRMVPPAFTLHRG